MKVYVFLWSVHKNNFMHKLWLVFSQAVTLSVAVLFVITVLRPDLLSLKSAQNVVTVREPIATAAISTQPSSYSAAAKVAMPSVVNIFTSKEIEVQSPLLDDPLFRHFFGDRFGAQTERSSSLGSGVIVSSEGYILTNHHVVEAADQIEVALADGRHAAAHIVGSDPETDLALLKIDLEKLPAIRIGRSERLQVGDIVLAIGNPFGVGQTVTMGIVSALKRSHLGINTYENFIQTDAAINPGNSGGALVDISGNLVGVNSAIYSRSGGSLGIGFAIPADIAKHVMEQIVRSGSVTRGWIGVEVQELSPELASTFKVVSGVLIARVVRNGPADKGDIKPGDVLVKVEQKSVTDSASMLELIAALKPGTNAIVTVVRNQKLLTLKINVGKRPKLTQDSSNN